MTAAYKCMMLGEIGVGKTSIVRRLVLDKFEADYKATLGVDIYTYSFAEGDFAGMPVQLAIWDIDGDMGESLFGHIYMQGASAAVVVGDASRYSTHQSMLHIARQFQEFMPGRPLSLVLNKTDLLADTGQIDPAGLGMHGALVETTSAKTGENVGRAFHKLTRQVVERGL